MNHTTLYLSFTSVLGFCLNFVECESFLKSNSSDILALCETNLDDSSDSGNFSVRDYLPLIWKVSVTHIHCFAVYVKEALPFTQDLSIENSADSYLCFWLALLQAVSYFFFLYQSPSSLCRVFDAISSNVDEVLSFNSSIIVFVFGGYFVHHKDWLTYSNGTGTRGELCYKFSISNDLTKMANFPTRIPDCESHSTALLDLFISSDASIRSTMAFSPLGNSDHTSAAGSAFCEWAQIGIMYISLIENIRSSLFHLHGFQLLVLLVVVHRNHLFCWYWHNKSCESKVKFRGLL